MSYSQENLSTESTSNEEVIEAVERVIDITETEEMDIIIRNIKGSIDRYPIPTIFDRTFIFSIIESDIRSNLRFFKAIRNNRPQYMVQVDEYNGVFLLFREFINIVLPTYITIQIRSAFSELTSIKDILNDITSHLQDEIERLTIVASEEEFKEAKFRKKDLSVEELNYILETHTKESIISDPLTECPICGNEGLESFYSCRKCQYKYCTDCCKEIASRQGLCPCCREELELIKHSH